MMVWVVYKLDIGALTT